MTVLTENEGLITQIIGPVIDVEFQPGQLPEIFDALEIYPEGGCKVVAEVYFPFSDFVLCLFFFI